MLVRVAVQTAQSQQRVQPLCDHTMADLEMTFETLDFVVGYVHLVQKVGVIELLTALDVT
jgi:hypothetical protein